MTKTIQKINTLLLFFAVTVFTFVPFLNVRAEIEDDDKYTEQEIEHIREIQKQQLEQENEDDNIVTPTEQVQPQIEPVLEEVPQPQPIIEKIQPTPKVEEKTVTQMIKQYQVNYVTQYRKKNNIIVHDNNNNGIVDEFENLQMGIK